MKHKPYNVKKPFSAGTTADYMRLRRDLQAELIVTVELLKMIRDVAVQIQSVDPPRWVFFKELEAMNQELRDVVERYK